MIKEHPGVPALAKRLLESVTEFTEVELDWFQKGEAGLRFRVKVEGLPIPGFNTGSYSAKDRISIDGIEDYTQQTDKGREDAARRRAAVEAWLATFGKPGRKPKKNGGAS